MNNTCDQLTLPPLGKRSPLLKFSSGNLRRAYYYTNAALFLLIFLIFGLIKYQQWQSAEQLKKTGIQAGTKIITLTYAQLGPPPSLLGSEGGAPTAATGSRPSAPVVGVPKPVPDAQAVVETSPDQALISGTSVIEGTSGEGGTQIRVEEVIPDINTYVPYSVAPRPAIQTTPRYPEIARKMNWEGTVYIKMLLDLDGSVMRVVVLKGSGYPQLDTAAVESALSWKFTPALQGKKPVRVWLGRPVIFKLK